MVFGECPYCSKVRKLFIGLVLAAVQLYNVQGRIVNFVKAMFTCYS